jgi:hypothetical protein
MKRLKPSLRVCSQDAWSRFDADTFLVDAYSAAIGKLIAGLSLWDPESVRDVLT